MGYGYLAIAILAEVIGTISLKSSNGFTKLVPSVVVVIGYGLAFYFLSLVIKTIPVGLAYAIWAGMGIVLIALIAAIMLKQTPDLPAMFGMVLIIAGVVVISIFSKTTGH